MRELELRRRLHELGQRAVTFYIDTGLCVFCSADDCQDIPHDIDCDVGECAGIKSTEERKAVLAVQREKADRMIESVIKKGDT